MNSSLKILSKLILLKFGSPKFVSLNSKKNSTTFDIRSWLGKKDIIKGTTKEDVFITLSKKDSRFLKVSLDYNGPVKAPIEKDQEIAKLNIYKKDELIRSIPV